jgi:hypothetical protein
MRDTLRTKSKLDFRPVAGDLCSVDSVARQIAGVTQARQRKQFPHSLQSLDRLLLLLRSLLGLLLQLLSLSFLGLLLLLLSLACSLPMTLSFFKPFARSSCLFQCPPSS